MYNYSPKGRWIVVDISRDAKLRGIYPPLFTDPEGNSRFSIYQIRWIKKCYLNFFFWNFRETTRHFSLRSQNSEYPRLFLVTGADENARKLLSTDLVNTKENYHECCHYFSSNSVNPASVTIAVKGPVLTLALRVRFNSILGWKTHYQSTPASPPP